MKNNEELVTKILEEKPIARTDDFILYGFALKECGVDLNMPLRTFLQNRRKLNAPNFKTIERARRIVQAQRPDLIDAMTSMHRQDEEEQYRNEFGGRSKK